MTGRRDLSRSKRYSAIKARLFVAETFILIASLYLFHIFISRPLSMGLGAFTDNFYLNCLLFGGALLLYMYLVTMPIDLARSFVVERSFGLSRQDLFSWAADQAKGVIFNALVSIPFIMVFYYLLRNYPFTWWILCALGWTLFSIFIAAILPVVVVPAFFKYLPLDDENTRADIMALAEKAGISLVDVCRIDMSAKTIKANAALVGLGATRKVILSDTLTGNFSRPEVVSVAAHEFAHLRYGHIWKLIAFSGTQTLVGLFMLSVMSPWIMTATGYSNLYDIGLLPFLMLLAYAGGSLTLPLRNWFSRMLEAQADSYALRLTERPGDFISMMSKLARLNLADTDPSPIKKMFMYDHPPLRERIRMAEGFKVAHERKE